MRITYFLIILLLSAFLFTVKDVIGFLSIEKFAGLDLAGNYSFAWLMHKLLAEGNTTGWTNLWFAGMPAFTFYPPLFFIVVAGLNYLSLGLIGLQLAYKLVVFASLFLFPLVVYFSFRRMGFKNDESFFVSLWSLIFLFLNDIFGGINQTLNFGLVAQMFALNIYFLFLGEVVRALKKKSVHYKELLVAGVLFGFIILSHVYVAALAVLSVIVLLAIFRNYRSLKISAFISLVGLLLSSFWWLPTLVNIQYAQPYYWNPLDLSQFSLLFISFSIFVFLGLDVRDKARVSFIVLFLILFFLGTQGLPIDKIQYDRFFFLSFAVGFILAGLGSYNLISFTREKLNLNQMQVLLPFTVFVIILVLATPLDKLWGSDLEVDGLLEWIKENAGDGRVLVESDSSLIEEHSMLMEMIPMETGKPVLNKVHLDSSISSPFTRTVRHEISANPYDISCELCQKAEIHPENKEMLLHHLSLFNVKYIVATNEDTKNYLDDFLVLKEEVDGFYVFEVPANGYYEIPKYKPVLIVSSFDKWKEFSEKVFLDKDLYNLTFIWSPKNVDGKFESVFVLENDVDGFMEKIKLEDVFVENDIKANISNFQFDDNTMKMSVDANTNVPVLVKFSYYPKWRGNADVFLASPSLIFVHAKGEVKLSII